MSANGGFVSGNMEGRYSRVVRLCRWFFVASSMLLLAGCIQKEGVSPQTHEVYLGSGERDTFRVQVDLANAPPSLEPLDVVLLFDATGSMGNIIDTVRENALDIMHGIRGVYENSNFGVVALYDYRPQFQPWRLYQDITADTGAVAAGLRSIVLDGGGDWPEAYSRGLYETRFLAWRKDARKYIILFGDAPAHDPTFYGKDYGIDPGRDGIPGTADDLHLKDVVAQIAGEKIAVIAVYDKGGWFSPKPEMEDAIKGFTYMASETGGMSIPVRSASDIPEAIKAGVREGYRHPPGLYVPTEYQQWVTASDPKKRDDTNRRYDFAVTLSLPDNTPEGVYRFPLVAMHGGTASGGEIGRTWVTIRVGLTNYEWRWPVLLVYLLLLPLMSFVLIRLRGRGKPVRYMRNSQRWSIGWRVLLLAVLISLPYVIWTRFPGPPASATAATAYGPAVPVATIR